MRTAFLLSNSVYVLFTIQPDQLKANNYSQSTDDYRRSRKRKSSSTSMAGSRTRIRFF